MTKEQSDKLSQEAWELETRALRLGSQEEREATYALATAKRVEAMGLGDD